MSYRALHWAWTREGLTSTQRVLLVALADMADESESCYPGQKRLARMCACDPGTVSRAMKALEQKGLVSRERRVRENGSRTSDRYVLAVGGDSLDGNLQDCNLPDPRLQFGGDQNPQRTTSSNTSSNRPSSFVFEALSNGALEPTFQEFWDVYPRRVGKAAALRAFRKALKQADVQVILEGARRYAADPNLPEKQFIPHPSTWLNRGSWDDEPLPQREQPSQSVDSSPDEWMDWRES